MASCANCGGELRPEWKFCVWCGTRVVAEAPAVAEVPVMAEASAVAAPVAAAPRAMAAPPVPAGARAHIPTLEVAAPPSPPVTPISIRTRSREPAPRARVNPLAIVALVLGCLLSPLAALFGHLALAQVRSSRERGRMPAIIAIVLGYGSLALVVVLLVAFLAGHA